MTHYPLLFSPELREVVWELRCTAQEVINQTQDVVNTLVALLNQVYKMQGFLRSDTLFEEEARPWKVKGLPPSQN